MKIRLVIEGTFNILGFRRPFRFTPVDKRVPANLSLGVAREALNWISRELRGEFAGSGVRGAVFVEIV